MRAPASTLHFAGLVRGKDVTRLYMKSKRGTKVVKEALGLVEK